NGKYYFYFPSISKDQSLGRGFSIGVAISDFPYGPFIPQPDPIKNVRGIDPNAFIDNNGQAYLYWSARKIFVAKLNDTMLELDSEPIIIDNLPTEGLKEGPFMFERNGIYYLTYPHVENNTERLEYAIADNPLGPFKVTGVIMDESPECWTNHQSIVEYKNQWFLFYHFNDLSPHFDKNRSVRADSLFFNEDGSIKKVLPTLRGVGISDAKSKIQIDRYSLKSDNGVTIEFIDTLKRFDGWKTLFDKADSWIQYNSVDFKEGNSKYLKLKIKSKDESNLQLVQDNSEGEILAEFKIPYSSDWKEINVPLLKTPQGVHNILLKLVDVYSVEIDWIHFE
ncbi:MAG: family 43 glycosylhydrolase, partial [Melioribacteraceae bacterium]|nr:family 43 glycosylhydrolase [Melioribacteraceae bacterium]